MSVASRETAIYRKDAKLNHNSLSPAEREKLLEVYSKASTRRKPHTYSLLEIPSCSPHTEYLATKQKCHHTNHTNRSASWGIKTWRTEISQDSATRPILRYSSHNILCLHKISTGISCCERQDTRYSILPPPNSRADTKGR